MQIQRHAHQGNVTGGQIMLHDTPIELNFRAFWPLLDQKVKGLASQKGLPDPDHQQCTQNGPDKT